MRALPPERNDVIIAIRDLPIDDEPAGIHAVVDGEHYSNGCCFNYGNASTNGLAVGSGTMESGSRIMSVFVDEVIA